MIKQIQNNISLKELTSFKVGGFAKYFYELRSIEELKSVLKWVNENKLPYFILGRGTNLVISDTGYDGLIIHIGKKFEEIKIFENTIKAQAGAMLNTVIKQAVENGLGGMEKMAGVPGTIGGAVRMNAGAFGQEIEQVCTQVTSLKTDGTIVNRNHNKCNFEYRHSLFCDNDEIILEAELRMLKSDYQSLETIKKETLIQRKSKQPLEYPNAGSMFKRPTGNYAGTLIEASGLKGFSVGGAMVSKKHANFVINKNQATATDIFKLTEEIIAKVKADSGITLEREVIFLGKF